MDAIIDLTARAVSFITLIQDTFLKVSVSPESTPLTPGLEDVFSRDFTPKFTRYIQVVKAHEKEKEHTDNRADGRTRSSAFESRVTELVWYSKNQLKEEDKLTAERYIIKVCTCLVNWIITNNAAIIKKVGLFGAFSPPYIWREAISEIVYSNIDQRVALARALEYLPIHVVLALGGGAYEAGEQRIFQWWEVSKKDAKIILSEDEQNLHEKFKEEVYNKFNKGLNSNASKELIESFYSEKIVYLLGHYKEMTRELLNSGAPLPFEYILNDELDEIKENRKLRQKELLLTDDDPERHQILTGTGVDTVNNKNIKEEHNSVVATEETRTCDPLARAKNMSLFALAFSGGGIRSATFNLGILQGLAKKGVISQVDYLSTVSGGGYIGSWLETWIKRDGGVTKVTDRLNPEKSPDPLGEEVRPVRWLRMFSNYFTPNSSIMSIDSWTVGVTWMRNMLLNQLIILLLFLTLFLLGNIVFEIWLALWWNDKNSTIVVSIWSALLIIVSAFAGLGMQAYQSDPIISLNKNQTEKVSKILLVMTLSGAFVISAWLFSNPANLPGKSLFSNVINKLNLLLVPALTTFISLLVIAYWGGYDKCIKSYNVNNANKSIFKTLSTQPTFIIIYTAAISALAGTLCLALIWQFLQLINTAHFRDFPLLNNDRLRRAVAFTLGLPLVLLSFGITVVARMALLGKYFPDERREWWGRMGAIINKFALIWLLVAGAALMGKDLAHVSIESWVGKPTTFAAWLALVASAVKAAHSSKTNGNGETKGFQATLLNILGLVGPYLFIIGLLVFLPVLITPLINAGANVFHLIRIKIGLNFPPFVMKYKEIIRLVILAIIMATATWRLSSRVGVNEFSMHHFYRNRLVRAYLGATRRKSSREKTANAFTGFDKLDDEKLSMFKNEQGYYGPYPILNTALNATQVTDLSRQDRKAESFIFSPLYCGFDFSKVRSSANSLNKSYDYGFRPTEQYAYPNDKGPGIGTAMAISGAAINPNQGYHSSAGTAFLLTVFNVQMGWWIGNPRKGKWQQSDPEFGLAYIISNLTGQTNTKNEFVCLSDGGHFDNMGLYELVRRRCAFIILGDGEQDENFTCEGFANAIRRCRIDFGAEIEINIDDIVKREKRFSKSHYSIGTIKYNGDESPTGTILYIKSSVTGKEPVDVVEYSSKNPTFPHQTTADQFFDEEQFESYRKLGLHIADLAMSDKEVLQALRLKYRKNKEDQVLDAIDKPVEKFVNTIKGFFI